MDIKLKLILDSPCGMRYIFDKLEIQSSFSRYILLESKMAISIDDIQKQYDELSEFLICFGKDNAFHHLSAKLRSKLSHVKDIRTTISSLSGESTLDDIEFFEVKNLAIISEDIRELLQDVDLHSTEIRLPDLSEMLNILDPEQQRINSFYVYDSYNNELKELRKIIRSGGGYTEEHLYRVAIIEQKVRAGLAVKLKPFSMDLEKSLYRLAKIDILLAKVHQLEELHLSIPCIGENKNSYRQLFNPEVKDILNKKGEEFQHVDIEFEASSPLLITGANMGGKSITLKTLALSQYLFQFGFGIPVEWAYISPVSNVFLSLGGVQSVQEGLSSFAAEMLQINDILKKIKKREFVLALIDEPAGTTNPLEGTALVTALLKILQKYNSLVIVTTHYNIDNIGCKRLRVRGFINNKMDYALVEDAGTNAPREALRIAATLKIDDEWIEIANKELKT
ncbi:MAG: DNA mismatch repair protein MutS [Prevotellaceae bacterium]|jgi:DNA mismatch repair ATPase MutS|nr:DNA mismatch repair protein MutS [Prevotellaceae bacterium]